MKVIVVGCGKTKRAHACAAKDLYIGPLFRLARKYAETHGDAWLIASAKYGLLQPGRCIEPYDRVIDKLSPDDVRQFGSWCQVDLSTFMHEKLGIASSVKAGNRFATWDDMPKFVFLAGKKYVDAICRWTFLRHYPGAISTPLEGLGIGERLNWLKSNLKEGKRC